MIDGLLEPLSQRARRSGSHVPLRIELPNQLPRDAAEHHAQAIRSIALPVEIINRLATLAHDAGAPRSTALLAAFNVLLFRLSGQDELIVGTPAANTTAVYVCIDGALSFDAVLRRTHDSTSGTGYPLPSNDGANVIFLADIVRPLPASISFDLALAYAEEPGGLRCSFIFAASCFASATIERWLESFSRLIREFVNAPHAPVAKLPMLAAAERDRLILEWNPEPRRCIGDAPLRTRFELNVARDPDAIAVVSHTLHWSYGELNARANRLARALRARDAGPGRIVAFAFERSIDTIVTMLAVVKAGAAYLPLDPSYPSERLRFMFADAGAHIVITNGSGAARLAGIAAPEACLDLAALDLDAHASGDLPQAGDPDDLAYIMYTSGTTGRPKGVLVTQRGITNLVTATPALAIYPSDVVAQLANVSFDAATYEIWGALLNGAQLVIAARETILVPDALATWLRHHRISVAFITSALLRHISRRAPAAFATLRCLIAGGDVVDPDTVRTIRAHGPPQRLVNGYGPTETTTFATTFEIIEPSDTGIPIGRPLANVQTYILDGDANPVPIGVRGQLYIGGLGLARGYVNDPELTARKFIRHPFSDDPDARLYATGDLARYRSDGNIEFLGRSDRQVKIRGFRIEMDEIQAAFLALPGVADAVITIREDEPGDKRIVAYVVDDARPQRGIARWRESLGRRLPEYMLPNAVIAVAAIPFNANGKIDTVALANSAAAYAAGGGADEPAQSPPERALAAIVGDVLGVPAVPLRANFFALGGHSLLAMRTIARIRERFGIDLSLRDFFSDPTVAGLARRVAAAPRSIRPLPPAVDAQRTLHPNAARPISLSAAQRRLWLLDELEPGAATYNVPYAFRLRGRLEPAALERALNAVVRRHDVLRATISVVDGEPAYVVDGQFNLNMPLVETASAAELDAVLLRERVRAFDLRRSVPIRALLVRCASDEHVLLVTLHHIATDGWSMGVLKRELSTFYAAERNVQALPFDDVAVTYADFAQREREQFDSDEFAARLAYWTASLQDTPPPLELGNRDAGLTPAVASGRLRSRTLAHSTRETLRQFCRERGSTEFSTLFAAFAVLLHGVTGRRDFIIGTVLANRTQSAFEGLIGFFVNTLALRVRIAGDPTFSAFQAQIHRSTLDAFDRQDIPFQKLVEVVKPPRVATRTPLFNVMFVVQNMPDDALVLAGLDVTPVPLERTTAKFDLTLEVTAGPSGELILALEYRTDLFDAPAIDALLEALETIVAGALGDPDTRLSHLWTCETLATQTRAAYRRPATPVTKREPPPGEVVVTETHVALRGVWERVLGIAPIGMNDNFFDLGGHSLAAVRLIGEIEKAFHLRLAVSLLFDRPTIDGLAWALGDGAGHAGADPIVTYNAEGSARPLFFLHGSIGGSGFYCRALADRLGPNRPFHVLRPHDAQRLPASIEASAAENIALIKHRSPRGPYLLGGYCAGGLVAFEMARQLRAGGDAVAAVVLIDVPDAPRSLRGIIDCIDRAGALLGVQACHRQRFAGALARTPHHAARLAASPAKFAFLAQRLKRGVRSNGTAEASHEPELAAWIRLAEAYVPRCYEGRLALLLTRPDGQASGGERAGWSSIAARVDRRQIAGSHLTCITEYLDDTAAALAEALAHEP